MDDLFTLIFINLLLQGLLFLDINLNSFLNPKHRRLFPRPFIQHVPSLPGNSDIQLTANRKDKKN